MSDDFGTVNLKRGERGREIEVLRHHYRKHRDALVAMTEEAPTQQLALEYQRLVSEIDRALSKLDELEGITPGDRVPLSAPPPPPPQRHPARSAPVIAPPPPSSAGMRSLAGASEDTEEHGFGTPPPDMPAGRKVPASRLAMIGGVALLALLLIGWLIWRASSDRGDTAVTGEIVEEQVVPPSDNTIAPAVEAPSALAATPAVHDFGVVRKGARATRQFELTNNSEEPMSIQVTRSQCRCLFYEHAPVIPPKAKETLTVTVDGGRAKVGELRETIRVSTKSDTAVGTSLELNATIQ